jgi:hypothetical protein
MTAPHTAERGYPVAGEGICVARHGERVVDRRRAGLPSGWGGQRVVAELLKQVPVDADLRQHPVVHRAEPLCALVDGVAVGFQARDLVLELGQQPLQ